MQAQGQDPQKAQGLSQTEPGAQEHHRPRHRSSAESQVEPRQRGRPPMGGSQRLSEHDVHEQAEPRRSHAGHERAFDHEPHRDVVVRQVIGVEGEPRQREQEAHEGGRRPP